MSAVLSYAIELAYQAGEILKGYARSGSVERNYKADQSIVTQADIASDEFITQGLRQHFPDDDVLSEELSPEYHGSRGDENHAVWVVDPLDGTTNYSLELPFWGTSLARLKYGWPEVAVILFPMLNELFTAERGAGACLNQDKLQIQPHKYHKTSFFSCCSRTFRNYVVDIPYKTRILGCASYSFCAVARSSAVLGLEATPKIWDIAAAWLILEEAGGKISPLDGIAPFPLRPGLNYFSRIFPTLAASTKERLDWGLKRIHPK